MKEVPKKVKPKKSNKDTKLLEDISEAIGHVLSELDDLQDRLKKVESRLGL
tara:strand:+ start:104 stop:256 length:153 start_codon:yes stop_codon:yes gene_type:complete